MPELPVRPPVVSGDIISKVAMIPVAINGKRRVNGG